MNRWNYVMVLLCALTMWACDGDDTDTNTAGAAGMGGEAGAGGEAGNEVETATAAMTVTDYATGDVIEGASVCNTANEGCSTSNAVSRRKFTSNLAIRLTSRDDNFNSVSFIIQPFY